MKKELWVLVANSSEAKIYRVENAKKLTEIAFLDHPESRLMSRDLVSDGLGRSFESANSARHALEPQTTPQQQEFNLFAKSISNYLDHARATGKYHAVYLAASPNFLGLLRQAFSTATQNTIGGEVHKDLTKASPAEISGYFTFSFI